MYFKSRVEKAQYRCQVRFGRLMMTPPTWLGTLLIPTIVATVFHSLANKVYKLFVGTPTVAFITFLVKLDIGLFVLLAGYLVLHRIMALKYQKDHPDAIETLDKVIKHLK